MNQTHTYYASTGDYLRLHTSPLTKSPKSRFLLAMAKVLAVDGHGLLSLQARNLQHLQLHRADGVRELPGYKVQSTK